MATEFSAFEIGTSFALCVLAHSGLLDVFMGSLEFSSFLASLCDFLLYLWVRVYEDCATRRKYVLEYLLQQGPHSQAQKYKHDRDDFYCNLFINSFIYIDVFICEKNSNVVDEACS